MRAILSTKQELPHSRKKVRRSSARPPNKKLEGLKMTNNINVVNCTPHDINLVTEKGNITFPRSGIIPRLTEQQNKINSINSNGIEIDIMEKSFNEVEGLPEPKENTIYIVSALVAGACKNRDDLVVPNDTIRDDQGRIVGCKNLAKI
jgi:hypothetical protein